MVKILTLNFNDDRSKRQFKNILLSFLYRGISIIATFITVPLCLNFLSKSTYGIWITIYSIVGWVALFDLGLGNGIKNKLSEALTKKDMLTAQKIVSTGYISMFLIAISVSVIFFLLSLFIDWSIILGIHTNNSHVNKLVCICFIVLAFRFCFDLISVILTAHQNVSYANLISCISNIITTASVFIVSKFQIIESYRLLFLGVMITFIPILISFLFSIYLFKTKFKELFPSFSLFDRKYVRHISLLGGQFFIIQAGALILLSTDNIIISRLFGPEEVTTYNIAYKLFSVFYIGWIIILSPYWTAFNEAYIKNDLTWIKKTVRMLLRLWLILIIAIILVVFFSAHLFKLWVGSSIHVPYILSIYMGFYIIAYAYSSIYAYFLNGIGKIKLQVLSTILAAIINISLAIFLSKYTGLGMPGVALAIALSLLINGILLSTQYKKIMTSTARNIWNS